MFVGTDITAPLDPIARYDVSEGSVMCGARTIPSAIMPSDRDIKARFSKHLKSDMTIVLGVDPRQHR